MGKNIMKKLTYKEICSIMNEEQKNGGKNRELQLKRWKDYGVVKEGKYYLLDDSSFVPPLVDKRSKYTSYIEILLLNQLSSLNKTDANFTYRELIELLGLVNEHYYFAKYNQKEYIEKLMSEYGEDSYEMLSYSLNIFFSKTKKMLKRLLKNSINIIENKSIIFQNKTIVLYKKEYNLETGRHHVELHTCDKKETAKFLDMQKEVMNKYKISKIKQYYSLDKQTKKDYNTDINKKIKETFNYDLYSCGINVVYSKKQAKEYSTEYISGIKNKLNENIQDKLLNSKELNIISKELKEQFVKDFIKLGGKQCQS